MTQHRQHHYHPHRHRHRMEIVFENPSVPLSTSSATTTTSQPGLPVRPLLHAPYRTAYDVDALLPADDYYARNRHGVIYGNPDGASLAPATVRRVDKSGLLEISETDPLVSSRPCVLAGAENVATRTMSLRVDRSGLLDVVPEVDQSEEHCSVSIELEAMPTSAIVTVATTTTKMSNEGEAVRHGGTLQTIADINSRVLPTSPIYYDGICSSKRPSSLEGQASSDDIITRCHSTETKVLAGSSRVPLDISKSTERLSYLSFSPGPSRDRLRNDSLANVATRMSPLISCCTDTDSTRLQNQKTLEIAAKYAPSNSPSQALTSILDHSSATSLGSSIAHTAVSTAVSTATSPITRGRREHPKDNVDVTKTNTSIESVVDTSKTYHESLFAKENTEQAIDLPGEERAEAEGCEHTNIENLEEGKVSFKGSNKLLDNDNVQTLRVIILSEQL